MFNVNYKIRHVKQLNILNIQKFGYHIKYKQLNINWVNKGCLFLHSDVPSE